MSNVIQYKGYFTNVEYSQEDQILFGKIEGIRDLVTFECENAGEVEQAFKEAVDDYLEFCEEEGKDPNKSFSGSFNVRVSPELPQRPGPHKWPGTAWSTAPHNM